MSELDIKKESEADFSKKWNNVGIYTPQNPRKYSNENESRKGDIESVKCLLDRFSPYASNNLWDCLPKWAEALISQEQLQFLKNLNLHILYTPGKNENESSIYIERKDWEYISIKTDDRYFWLSWLTITKDRPAKITQEWEWIRFEQWPYSYYIPRQEIEK